MGGVARAVGNRYDLNGNRIRVIHPDTSFFTYELDGLDRPLRIRENGGDPIAAFTYDSAGRRASSGWAATTSYGYDPVGRLQTQSHDLAGSSRDHALGFTYNPASQVESRSSSNDAYAWTGAVNVSRPYSVNGLNQYTSAGSATFGYDPNGNLASTANAPWSTAYVYDVENRLVSASGTHNAELLYDPLGRLFQVSSPATGARRLVYDGDALVAEYDTGGYMLNRYVHGNDSGADDPLVWYDNFYSGWRRALLTDHQGSVIQVADMNGNPLATNSYDPWGVPAAGNAGRFGYTGQAWVPGLGLWYYKARFYSPTTGRFLQVDPVGYGGGMNLYGYVGNDPVNATDPSGLARICTPDTGRLAAACVNVDGDGDGKVNDKDLSPAQINSMSRAFSGFIRDNPGANLSRSGTATYGVGGATAEQVNYVRAIGQFVGRSLPGGWGRAEILVNPRLGSDTAEKANRVVDRWEVARFEYNINPDFMDHPSNPSSVARSMFHGFGHRLDREIHGNMIYPINNPRHQGVDLWARRLVMQSGLGGGGCPAIGGGLFGLIGPDYPGC